MTQKQDKNIIPSKRNKTASDPRATKYKVGMMAAIVMMVVYGYSLYNAVRLGRTSKMYINGAILLAWFLLCLYWLRQLGLLYKSRDETQHNDRQRKPPEGNTGK